MPALGIDLCPPEIFIPPGQGPNAIWPSTYITPLDQVVNAPGLVDVEALTWAALEPGAYTYRITAFWSTSRRHTGIRVAVEFTGSILTFRYYLRDAVNVLSHAESSVTRGKVTPVINWLTVDGIVVAESAGDLKLQIASEDHHPVTLQAGSFGSLTRSRS